MENTFESALEYLNNLKLVSPAVLSDDKILASVLMSYSAKTNAPDKNLLRSFADKFRQWQHQWDLFGKGMIDKPQNLDEFIDSICG